MRGRSPRIEPNQCRFADLRALLSNWPQTAEVKVQANVRTSKVGLTVHLPVVVIVDDDPAVCSALKFSLELEGFAVRAYGSGAELLHADDLGSCTCFVIDQRMPAMSGLDLIGTLRDRDISAPAILITTYPNAALSARAALADIPIVEKPLLGNTLVNMIREACQRG